MNGKVSAKPEKWYSFFYTFFGFTTDAQLIKLFFAPIYLYQRQLNAAPQPMGCDAWLDFYGRNILAYRYPEDPFDWDADPEKAMLHRIRLLGDHLTEQASAKVGEDLDPYFGKNRNVCSFPERFLSVFIPAPVSNTKNDLEDYYSTVLFKLFEGHEALLTPCLERLRAFNRETPWLHVPSVPVSSSNTETAERDELGYLLSSFSILSAAYHIEQNPKAAGRTNLPADAFYQAQILLEVETSYVPRKESSAARVGVSLQHFVELSVQLLTSCEFSIQAAQRSQHSVHTAWNRELQCLQLLTEICSGLVMPEQISKQDERRIRQLADMLGNAKTQLIATLSGSDPADINMILRLCVGIADLEEFWRKVPRSS